ncbi:MAG: hypothetical protein GF353_20435 [Candidatus Lokiarchaeota archaeon]|nr:hypothetical protein [Candidatus Lokiarchaeota archaeon]
MDEYFRPTEYWHCQNLLIIEKAKNLTNNDDTPKETALNIFYFVRERYLIWWITWLKHQNWAKNGV